MLELLHRHEDPSIVVFDPPATRLISPSSTRPRQGFRAAARPRVLDTRARWILTSSSSARPRQGFRAADTRGGAREDAAASRDEPLRRFGRMLRRLAPAEVHSPRRPPTPTLPLATTLERPRRPKNPPSSSRPRHGFSAAARPRVEHVLCGGARQDATASRYEPLRRLGRTRRRAGRIRGLRQALADVHSPRRPPPPTRSPARTYAPGRRFLHVFTMAISQLLLLLMTQVPPRSVDMARGKAKASSSSSSSKGNGGGSSNNNGSKGKECSNGMESSNSNKGDSSTWRGPWCVLLQGERATPVVQYLTQFGVDIICTLPPPGETAAEVKGSFIDPAKEVIGKLICMVFRELDEGLYFTSLNLKNIFVNDHVIVKIKDRNVIKDGPSDKQKEETVHALGNIIGDIVTAASPSYARNKAVNPELKHLLSIMKAYTIGKSSYLMRFHPVNVPDHARGFYSIVIHDETMNVIRYSDAQGFHYIVDGVEVPLDWLSKMESNTILKKYLTRGHYATMGGVPKLVPIKCLRNVPSHGREDAGDVNGPSFTRGDIARALYDKAPLALCSMAKGLDTLGILKNLRLDELFPGRVKFHKPT